MAKLKISGPEEAIRAPQQARSRETMDRILEAFETLLKEKTFDKITMIELAQSSGTGTSSIYARFKDKQTLISAMHMRLQEKALLCLAELADPEHWEGKSIDLIVSRAVASAFLFHQEHSSLIRAALFVDDENVRERQASVLRAAAQQFSEIIVPRAPLSAREINEAIDGCCRIFASISYSMSIFGPVDLGRQPIPDRTLRRQLVVAMTALVKDAIESSATTASSVDAPGPQG